jgi:signal transduction histidine kinase
MRKWFNTLTIRRRVAVIIFATMASVLLLTSVIFGAVETVHISRTVTAELRSTARLVGSSAAAAIVFEAPDSVANLLKSLAFNPAISGVWLYRNDGTTFAKYKRPNAPHDNPNELLQKAQGAEDGVAYDLSNRLVYFSDSVVLENDVVGTVLLAVELSVFWHEIATFMFTALFVLGAMPPVGYVLAKWLGASILRPINDLSITMERVGSDGGLALRAHEHSQDEIGVLTRSFNSMLASIEERDRALAAHGVRLEAEVERRTTELVTARDTAEAASRAKTEFLSNMSHELRTPMNAVLGFAQLLDMDEDQSLSNDQLQSVTMILNSGEHLLNLIEEILDLSAVDSGHARLDIQPVPLRDILDQVQDLAVGLTREKNIQVRDVSKTQEPMLVLVDRQRLLQCILNLVSNAIKYNKDGGHVLLGFRHLEDGDVRVSVTDNGPGIPSDRQHQLFQPFNRLGAESSGIAGAGIGLTVTERLVEAMGARLGFKSELGEGSSFWIDLKRSTSEADISAEA